MDGRMHRKTAEWAARKAQGEVWKKYIAEISDSSTYPDAYVFGIDAPDKMGWDRYWKELVLIPHDGKAIPMHRIYDTQDLRTTYPEVIRYLVHLSLTALRKGNEELGAKAAGTLTHLTGDTYQPAHATDNRMVLMMYPQGEYRYMVHAFMEAVLCDIDEEIDYKPRILADTEEELVWRITEEMEKGRQQSISEIPILMGALRSGDSKAAEASAIRTATYCAMMNADIFESIYALWKGAGRSEKSLKLTAIPFVDVVSDNLYNFEAMFDAIPGKDWYTPNPLNIGDGDTWGISLLPILAQSYMDIRKAFITYHIENCGYTAFKCRLGLQHFQDPDNLPYEKRGNETSCIFEIRLDGKAVYRSEPISEQDAPTEVCVQLDGAKELMLHVRDVREPNALTCFVYPVFAEPSLIKG